MTVKAVIDTNIWVSALINPFGFPAKLRNAFERGLFQPVISEPMIEGVRWTHLSRHFFHKVKLHFGAVFGFYLCLLTP